MIGKKANIGTGEEGFDVKKGFIKSEAGVVSPAGEDTSPEARTVGGALIVAGQGASTAAAGGAFIFASGA